MGRLANLKDGIADVRSRLDAGENLAESRMVDINAVMDGQYNRLSSRISKELSRLVSESQSSQDQRFAASVQRTVDALLKNQDVLLNSLSRWSLDGVNSSKAISGEIGKVSNRVEVESISRQVIALGLQVDALPKEFPIPKDVDLSGLAADIAKLNVSIGNIKFPKTVDVTPQLKAMEKRMSKRVVDFDVTYDPLSKDITNIRVTEDNI